MGMSGKCTLMVKVTWYEDGMQKEENDSIEIW